MKTLANLLVSLILTGWVIAIALVSIQNAAPVSLKFLTFESIQLPVGLVLAFSAGLGIIGTAIMQALWSLTSSRQRSTTENDRDDEFFSAYEDR